MSGNDNSGCFATLTISGLFGILAMIKFGFWGGIISIVIMAFVIHIITSE